MSSSEAVSEPFLFDEDPEDKPVNVKGISESAKYYQNLISKLDLIDEEQSRRFFYQVGLGQDVQEAINYAVWAELPEDEDFKRWQELAKQGEIARDRLIVGHLRLVAHIARLTMGWVPFGSELTNRRGESIFKGAIHKDLSNFSGAPFPLEDRIQAGTLGLMQAVENYKPGRANFVTYAFYGIENSIARAIDRDRRIKIPLDTLERCRKIGKVSTRLLLELGREATIDEICEVTGLAYWHVTEAIEAQKTAMQVESLQDIMPDDPDESAKVEEGFRPPREIPIDYDQEYFEQIMLEQEIDQLLEVFDPKRALDQRYRDILAMRFGLATGEPMILEEIGAQIGCTRERVRQLETQALLELRTRTSKRQREVWAKSASDISIQAIQEKERRDKYTRSLRMAAQIVSAAHFAAAGGD